MSLDTKAKIILSKKGKGNHRLGTRHSEDTKKKISESRMGAKNPMYGNTVGHKHTEANKLKMSELLKISYANGRIHPMQGKKFSLESLLKMSESHLGNTHSIETRQKLSISHRKEKHWAWKEDRMQIKGRENRNNPEYKRWHKEVLIRDGFKCRIANEDCSGRLETHHILEWSKHPELRYKVNNGISVCCFHHPLKREDVRRLIPAFTKLVGSSD